MTKYQNRIGFSVTLLPKAYEILTEAKEDWSLPVARTLDVIILEWDEMSRQKQERVSRTDQTVASISDRMAELEKGICSILIKLEKAEQKGRLSLVQEPPERELKKSVSS